MGQLEHFLKNPGSGLQILPYGRGRPGEGGRLNADKGRRGVKNWQSFADVFYGWPLIYIIIPKCACVCVCAGFI